MSGTLNKVMLIGHLGDEIKIHFFEGGNCIGRFPLATNETYTNKQTGERVTNTDWHNIVMWRGLAKVAESYLKKGMKVYIEGKLKTRSYTDENNVTKYTTEVVADEMTMLSRAENTGNNPNYPSSIEENKPKESKQDISASPEDDLPF